MSRKHASTFDSDVGGQPRFRLRGFHLIRTEGAKFSRIVLVSRFSSVVGANLNFLGAQKVIRSWSTYAGVAPRSSVTTQILLLIYSAQYDMSFWIPASLQKLSAWGL